MIDAKEFDRQDLPYLSLSRSLSPPFLFSSLSLSLSSLLMEVVAIQERGRNETSDINCKSFYNGNLRHNKLVCLFVNTFLTVTKVKIS
jgi:hypothetical protein